MPLHQPVGARVGKFLQIAGLEDVRHLGLAAACVVSLAASLLVLRAFEEPARLAIRRWSDAWLAERSRREVPGLSPTV